MTALLAALAVQRNTSTDETLTSLTNRTHDRIVTGQEEPLRTEIAQTKQDNRDTIIKQTQLDLLKNPLEFPGVKVGDLMTAEIVNRSTLDPVSLEKDGVAAIQEHAAQDRHQATLMERLMDRGDVLDQVRDHGVKMQILSAAVDNLRHEKESQGTIANAMNWLASFIPTNDLTAKIGIVPNAGTSSFDLPGTRLRKEVATLQNMSLKDFQAALPGVLKEIDRQSGYIGDNKTIALQAAQNLFGVSDSDALTFNLWSAADVAGLLPIGAMVKFAKDPIKFATLMGDRAGAVKNAAVTIAKNAAGIPLEKTEPGVASIEEMLPSSVLAIKDRPWVGASSDVVDALDNMREASRAVVLSRTARLTPEQEMEAARQAIETAELRYKDENIVDFKEVQEGLKPNRSAFATADEHAAQVTSIEAEAGSSHGWTVRDEVSQETVIRKTDLLSPDGTWDMKATGDRISQQVAGAIKAGSKVTIHTEGKEIPIVSVKGGKMRDAKGNPWGSGAIMFAKNGADDRIVISSEASVRPARPDEIPALQPADASRSFSSKLPFGDKVEVVKDEGSGIQRLHIYLGKKVGNGGYLTEQAAKGAAVRRGFSLDDVSIIQGADGQHFIRVTQDVTETGVSSPGLKGAGFGNGGPISHKIKNPDSIMPDILNEARLASTLQKSHIQKYVLKPMVDKLNAIGRGSRRTLSKVMAVGEESQTWFTVPELQAHWERIAKRPATDKEIMAYYASKELSDVNYVIHNNNIYIEKARRGVVTVQAEDAATKFDTGRVNGYVIDNPDFENTRMFNLDDHESYVRGQTSNTALKEKWATGNYRVIRLEVPKKIDGEPVEYILAHKRSSTVGPLERKQLNYVSGGSRENVNKYFVKQHVQGKFNDGTVYHMTPTTHIAAKTRYQAREWADQMERARQAYSDPTLTNLQKREIIEDSPVESYDKFEAMVADGSIQRDTPFEVLFDKEQPDALANQGLNITNFSDERLTPNEQYYISKGRMYYSHKGERLKDPEGEYAEILDPYRTLSRAINNAVNTQAFSDYNRKVIEEWSRFSQQYLKPQSVGTNLSPWNIFMNGELSDKLRLSNPKLYAQLEATRNIHKRFLNQLDPKQTTRELATRRFADWVDSKGKLGDWAAGTALNSLSRNPVDALRGFIFDTQLGFFDPGQLVVQTQTAVAAVTVHPIYGARSVAMTWPVLKLMVNRSDNLLDYVANNLKAIHGLPPPEFKTMVRELRNNSWLNVGGEVQQLDTYINKVGGGTVNTIRNAGRYPFFLAERINRATTYQIAWSVIKKEAPDLAVGSADFLSKVLKRADDLAMNMTSASKASWQSGVLSIPTQFMSYQARVLEAMLPKSFGGNPRLSGAQKGRLFVGQAFLYGAGGVYGADAMLDYFNDQHVKATGEKLSPEVWRVMSKGFFDSALNLVSGGALDTDLSQRVGQGANLSQLIQKLSDGTLTSPAEAFGGATVTITEGVINSAVKLGQYFHAEQGEDLSAEEFKLVASDLTQNIASMKRASKAMWIWRTGKLVDEKTGVPIVDATTAEGFAAALGVPLRQETERWEIIESMKERDQEVKDVAQLLVKARRSAFEAMSAGDTKGSEHYTRLAQGLLQGYRKDALLQSEIVKETDKQLGYTAQEWNSLIMRLYQRTGEHPAGGN